MTGAAVARLRTLRWTRDQLADRLAELGREISRVEHELAHGEREEATP